MKDFFKMMFASCLGTLMVIFVLIFLSIGIIGVVITSTFNQKPMMISKNSVLVIDLDRPIYEKESSDLEIILSSTNEISLNKILQAIKHAKNDHNITGIYVKESGGLQAGWATMEEIRNALIDFKESDKFVYAYADNYTQKGYYVATAANKIYLHPAGFLEFTGLSAETMFFKDLLSKLEIDVELIRPNSNTYKSAGEMFLLDKMSEASREQVRAYLNSMWEHISQNIANKRDISVSKLNDIADNLSGFMASDALKVKLIDQLTFESDIFNEIKTHTSDEKITDIQFIPVKKYSKTLTEPHAKLQIAVIYAEGDVEAGTGFNGRTIYSDNLVKSIRQAANDDDVKAIVLRVNSHGGSAIASEIITNEIFLAKKKKPVVASFGDVAASAGYEIASLSTKIIAQPNTITGSIGVFGVIPNFGKLLKNKLGITFDTVKTNQNSALLSMTRELSPAERNLLQKNVEEFYKTFCQRVALGRNLTPEYVDSIGRGRVWTGSEAKRIGLVDELGGISDAIKLAAKLANINNYSILELPSKKDPYLQIREMLENEASAKLLNGKLEQVYQFYQQLNNVSNMSGTQARLPYLITIN